MHGYITPSTTKLTAKTSIQDIAFLQSRASRNNSGGQKGTVYDGSYDNQLFL